MGAYTDLNELIDRYGCQDIIDATNDRDLPAEVTCDILKRFADSGTSPTWSTGLTQDQIDAVVRLGEIVDKAIADSESEINSRLEGMYALPLTVVPIVLVARASDMSMFYLYKFGVPQAIKDRVDMGMMWLRDLQKGTVNIGLSASDAETERIGGASHKAVNSTSGRVFSRKDLQNYIDPTGAKKITV
jgi:phage gp36-like protein